MQRQPAAPNLDVQTDADTAEGDESRTSSEGSGEVERRLASVLARVEVPAPTSDMSGASALRVARVVALQGRTARVVWRGASQPVEARLADEVEALLITRAVEEKGLVLIEQGGEDIVVGVLQTHSTSPQRPPLNDVTLRGRTVRLESEGTLSLRAEKIEVEGGSEVLLRVGPVALRLRRDGTVELVGSSVYLTSRGVFRLIGRVLRLN